MHIGLVIYGPLTTLSGGYLYDRMLVQNWRASGHEVTVLPMPARSYSRHLLDNAWSSWARRVAALPLDVLVQDELNHPSLAWLNARLRQHATYPIVSIVHHLRVSEPHPRRFHLLLQPIEEFVERRYLNSVDALICNSETTRATVEARLQTPKPICVAPPAADHLAPPRSFFAFKSSSASDAERTPTKQMLQLLFVGNVIARKGLSTLIDALALLPHCRLAIVGDLSVEPHYTECVFGQVRRQQLTDRVSFTGELSTEALHRRYATADLFAMPSYEGFGIVYLEAMSFGVPVLASTAGAAHEIVEPGHNGFLVAPNDPAAIVDALQSVDQSTLRRMGRNARARYEQHPTWAETAASSADFLAEVTRNYQLRRLADSNNRKAGDA